MPERCLSFEDYVQSTCYYLVRPTVDHPPRPQTILSGDSGICSHRLPKGARAFEITLRRAGEEVMAAPSRTPLNPPVLDLPEKHSSHPRTTPPAICPSTLEGLIGWPQSLPYHHRTSRDATVTDITVWQFAFLPNDEALWRHTDRVAPLLRHCRIINDPKGIGIGHRPVSSSTGLPSVRCPMSRQLQSDAAGHGPPRCREQPSAAHSCDHPDRFNP